MDKPDQTAPEADKASAQIQDKKKSKKTKKDDIIINPDIEQVMEAADKPAVFTFGRMNPPTIGHEKLVKKVMDVARQNRGMAHVYTSHSQDKNKNPLDYDDKIKLLQRAFGGAVIKSPARTVIEVMKHLEQMGHKTAIMVAGSDRVKEFETLLNKYNGKDYNFESIEVVSAGERDPDAEGAEGMSASKMRQAVKDGNVNQFTQGLPRALKSQGKLIFDLVKAGMELQEDLELAGLFELDEAVLDLQQRRKRALIMRRYKAKIMRGRAIAQRRMAREKNLRMRAQRMARKIVRKRVAGQRGVNYQELSPSDKIQVDRLVDKKSALVQKLAKRLFPRVKQAELKRLVKARQDHNALIKNGFEPEYVDMIIEQLSEMEVNDVFEVIYEQEYNKAEIARQARKEADEMSQTFSRGEEEDARLLRNRKLQKVQKHVIEDVEIDINYISSLFEEVEGRLYENIVQDTAKKHKQEKESLKLKHDREMDRARLADARAENRQEQVEVIEGLLKKATKSGIDYNTLKEVYDRGLKAWDGKHGMQEQYAYERVNSYIAKGKTYYTDDKDLHEMELDPKLQQRIDAAVQRLNEQLQSVKSKLNESKSPLETAKVLAKIQEIKLRIENINEEYRDHDTNKVADMFFEASKDESEKRMKLRRLAKLGLVDKDDYAKFDIIMGKMARADGNTDKLNQKEKAFLSTIYDKLTDVIAADPTVFQKYRQNLTKAQKDENS